MVAYNPILNRRMFQAPQTPGADLNAGGFMNQQNPGMNQQGIMSAMPPADVAAQPLQVAMVNPQQLTQVRPKTINLKPVIKPRVLDDQQKEPPKVESPPESQEPPEQIIKKTIQKRANEAVRNNETTAEDADKKLIEAGNRANSILSTKMDTGSNEEALKTQFDALGVRFDPKNYNSQAKKMLGLDEKESDVPEWAAPMFLFGLQLMRGPVTSKQQGMTGLGGLLADVGEAGKAGFAQFGAERDRRRKQRSAVASLASQLRTQDISTWSTLRKESIRSKEFQQTFGLKLDQFGANQADKSITRITKGLNSTQNAEVTGAWMDAAAGMTSLSEAEKAAAAKAKVPLDVAQQMKQRRFYKNPMQQRLAEKIALNTVTPNPDIKTIDSPSGKMVYDQTALAVTFKRLSKEQKEKFKSPTGLLQAAVNKENGVPEGFMITQGTPKFDIRNVPAGPGLVREVIRDLNKVGDDGMPTIVSEGQIYSKTKPNYKQFSFTKADGSTQNLLINPDALARSKKPLKELLAETNAGTKHANIFMDLPDDHAQLAKDIEMRTIYGANNTTQKALWNKRASSAFLADKDKREAYNAETDEAKKLKMLIKNKVYTIVPGSQKKVGANSTFLSVDRNGQITRMEGAPGEISALQDKEAAKKFTDKLQFTRGANNSAAQIHNIFKRLPDQDQTFVATKLTEYANAMTGVLANLGSAAAARAKSVSSLRKLRSFTRENAENSTNMDRVINSFETSLDSFVSKVAENSDDRQRLKSLFIDLAFQVASSREGGKLTDNDVKYAFDTLGFDADSWFQSPRKILAGTYQGLRTINDRMALLGTTSGAVPQAELDKLKQENKTWLNNALSHNIDLNEGLTEWKKQGKETSDNLKPSYRYDTWIDNNFPSNVAPRPTNDRTGESAGGQQPLRQGEQQINLTDRITGGPGDWNSTKINLQNADALLFNQIFTGGIPNDKLGLVNAVKNWAGGDLNSPKGQQGIQFLKRLEDSGVLKTD